MRTGLAFRSFGILPLLLFLLSSPRSGSAQELSEAEMTSRWKDLQSVLFPGKTLEESGNQISIKVPNRAADAAQVPVELTLLGAKNIKGVYLIIDANPVPLAAHVEFGPKADAHSLKFPVRVNEYTYLHAVAETRDGKFLSAAAFVKASGGCSAPPDEDAAKAMSQLGKLKVTSDSAKAGQPLRVQLAISHPNFNGMQMNQITRLYTPARFIRSIDVLYDDVEVMHVASDISLASDPKIDFGIATAQKGTLRVLVKDTDGAEYGNSFELPTPAQ